MASKYKTYANPYQPIKIRAGYEGMWFYPTDATGNYANSRMERTIWDSAYGTYSADFDKLPVITGEGSISVSDGSDVRDYSIAVQELMRQHEADVYSNVVNLSKAKNHGYMKNLDTGEIKKFQFNPEKLEYSRGVNYVDNSSPGMGYPRQQFVRGNSREFDVELFMYDRQLEPCGIIKDYINFIGAFLPPEENTEGWQRPPQMLFFYGYFVRKCVLTNFNILIDTMDENGTPTQAHLTMTLRQVGVV